MKRVFEYTRKAEFEKLNSDQQRFTAKMIVKEVEKYAKEHDIPPELVYEFYCKGLFGSDRFMGGKDGELSAKLAESEEAGMEREYSNQTDQTEHSDVLSMKKNDEYLECGLPEQIQHSIKQLLEGREKVNSGKHYSQLDMDWAELNADIGTYFAEGEISLRQAEYLRNKYLL